MQQVSAPNRRRNAGRKQRRGTVIAIISGTHGVGKTALARNIAARMACVVVDGPTGCDPALHAVAEHCDWLVIVTCPEAEMLVDAYGMLKYAVQMETEARIGLIVNRACSAAGAARIAGRLNRTADRFLGRTCEYLGWVFDCERVEAITRDAPSPPGAFPPSTASACLDEICERLGRAQQPRLRPGWLWPRVASIFL